VAIPTRIMESHEQLVRLLPQERKNPQAPASLPRPQVAAKHAVFLFLRCPGELKEDEQETLSHLRQLHPELEDRKSTRLNSSHRL